VRKANTTLLVISILLIVGFCLRSYEIDLRPFHHDEGVNYHFLREAIRRGFYPYSNENYHGPFYFYFANFIRIIYGDSEFAIRLPSIISGVLLLCAPVIVSGSQGIIFCLISALFFAISPSLIFHSRYAIHEMTFVTLSIFLGLCSYNWILNSNKKRELIYLALFLALLISTKETFIITTFSIVLGLVAAFGPSKILNCLKSQSKELYVSFILFVTVLFGIFSAGFRWGDGLKEMFMAIPQWIGRSSSDTGHFKPFIYYAKAILKTESWLLYVPLLVIFYLLIEFLVFRFKLKRKAPLYHLFIEDRFLRFITIWAITQSAVYGFVQYKTPWLIINQTAVMILLFAKILSLLIEHFNLKVKILSFLVVFICTILSLISSYLYNIKISFGSQNPYSYVHTSAGMIRMVDDIIQYRKHFPSARVLIGVNTYWPLPYYVRNFESFVAYQKDAKAQSQFNQFGVMILDKTENWQDKSWTRKYYRLSDVQESFVYFRVK